MDFVKKHYEKVILSVVLLGMVGFLIFMLFYIPEEIRKMKELAEGIIKHKAEPLPPVDLTRQAAIMGRLKAPVSFDFSTTNRLFNPLEWKRNPDGTMFPMRNGNETGPGAAVVTRITPLYFTLSFDSVETNGLAPRYVIGVEHQGAEKPAQRRKQQRFLSLGEKKDSFILSEVKGDPAAPDALVLKLTDSGDMVTLSRDKTFQRVEGYTADLKYELDKSPKNFAGLRVGSRIAFGFDDYIVVAVDANSVVLLAQSNQKKTTLPYAP